jgi:hypothetical protein
LPGNLAGRASFLGARHDAGEKDDAIFDVDVSDVELAHSAIAGQRSNNLAAYFFVS